MNTHLRRLFSFVVALASVSAFLDGCASSRLLKVPKPADENDVGWMAVGPGAITLEVHQLIFRNAGGSWLKNANWDEYVLTIKNESQISVEIQSFYLYSDKL